MFWNALTISDGDGQIIPISSYDTPKNKLINFQTNRKSTH